MEYKVCTGEETLKDDGFEIFVNYLIRDKVKQINSSLEVIASKCKSQDVFRTKLGDIKQIQNMHLYEPPIFYDLNTNLAKLLGCTNFKVLNNQYFCKPPN